MGCNDFLEVRGLRAGRNELSPAASGLVAAGDRKCVTYSPQHNRFIFFFPEGETAITTSTFFPQLRQSCALLLFSALAATSVFDFPFSAMIHPPFAILYSSDRFYVQSPVSLFSQTLFLLREIRSVMQTELKEGSKLSTIIQKR